MEKKIVKIVNDFGIVPKRGTASSVGYDLYFPVDVTIAPKQKAITNLGFKLELPEGTYARIDHRSNLGKRQDLPIIIKHAAKYYEVNDEKNSVIENIAISGIIDSDYRGYIHLITHNIGDQQINIRAGESFAQLIIENMVLTQLVECSENELTQTIEVKVVLDLRLEPVYRFQTSILLKILLIV